jgi:Flp pilus assembly protein TadG
MVEFALVFPVFVLILGVAFAVSQFLTSVVGLNGAARAGAITAANDVNANANIVASIELADVVATVNAEEGCSGCYVAATTATDPTTCPQVDCVWIIKSNGQRSGSTVIIDTVHIRHKVVPFVPIVSGISVQTQAGATP